MQLIPPGPEGANGSGAAQSEARGRAPPVESTQAHVLQAHRRAESQMMKKPRSSAGGARKPERSNEASHADVVDNCEGVDTVPSRTTCPNDDGGGCPAQRSGEAKGPHTYTHAHTDTQTHRDTHTLKVGARDCYCSFS
eukprot:3868003-Alexandrium_andersonii.AAC.1